MALCCCPLFFKDNLLFSKHLQPLLSRKGGPWKLSQRFLREEPAGPRQEVVCVVFPQASYGWNCVFSQSPELLVLMAQGRGLKA